MEKIASSSMKSLRPVWTTDFDSTGVLSLKSTHSLSMSNSGTPMLPMRL